MSNKNTNLIEDVTSLSNLDGQEVLKDAHSHPGHYLRTRDSFTVVKPHFDTFNITYNNDKLPTKVEYLAGIKSHTTQVATVADVSSNLNNKYFLIYSGLSGEKFYVWFNVGSTGTDPAITDATGIEIPIEANDPDNIVAKSLYLILKASYSRFFEPSIRNAVVTIRAKKVGKTNNSSDINTGFTISNEAGINEVVDIVHLDYNGNNPIWQGVELKRYEYDVFTGKFIKNNEIDTLSKTNENKDAIRTLSNFDIKNLDAYGQIITSSPNIVFDAFFDIDNKNLLFTSNTVGGGTITRDTTTSTSRANVGTASGDKALRQTKNYHLYTPGQEQRILISGGFGVAKENLSQKLGYYDDENGMYWQYNNNTLSVILRSSRTGSVVNETISQSDFNLDKLDGTGESGFIIDPEKFNFYLISFQWQGTGQIRFGVYHKGEIVWCHRLLKENTLTSAYMPTPSLPIRWEIENLAATASISSIGIGCVAVQRFGEFNAAIRPGTTPTAPTFQSITDTEWTPLTSIRLKSDKIRAQLTPLNISVISDANKPVAYQIILNGTLTSASFVSAGAESVAEYDISATAITGGTPLKQYVAAGNDKISPEFDSLFLKLAADYAGTADILTIAARTFSTNGSAFATINYEEMS